jgi:hypothetical protein
MTVDFTDRLHLRLLYHQVLAFDDQNLFPSSLLTVMTRRRSKAKRLPQAPT